MKTPNGGNGLVPGLLCWIHWLALAFVLAGAASSARAATSTISTTTLNVKDYGAVPNGLVDSTDAINRALQDAVNIENKPVTVQFEAGTYLISCTNYSNAPCLNLNGVSLTATSGINIQGSASGTLLLIGNPNAGGLQIQNASQINVSNLIFDYVTPPFTQGKITEINDQSFDFQVDPDMPEMPDALCSLYGTSGTSDSLGYYPIESFGLLMEKTNPRSVSRGGPIASYVPLSSCEKIGAMKWRIGTTTDALAAMSVGAPYVQLVGRHWTKNGIAVFSSKDVSIENVEIRAAGGVAVLFALSEGLLHVNGLKVTFPPSSGRLITTDADGVHCQHNWGTPIIENSTFEGMADDGTNNYTLANYVTAVYSPTSIQVRLEREIRVGDRIEFQSRSGVIRGAANVLSLTPVSDTDRDIHARDWIEFQSHEGVIRGTTNVLPLTPVSDKPSIAKLSLSQAVDGLVADPAGLSGDMIFDISAAGPYSVIRNNTIGRHRGRDVVTHSAGGLIENNTFGDINWTAIDLAPNFDWHEGPSAHDLTIQGNHFYRGDASYWLAPAQISAKGGATGITMKDNQFYSAPGISIDVGTAYSVNILNSRIFADGTRPRLVSGGVVNVQDSRAITVDGMIIQGPRPNTQPPYVTVANSVNVTVSNVVVASNAPICTLTAKPASISKNGTSTLTTICSPTATSYSWTGGNCSGTTASTCVEKPGVTTAYSVTGTNSYGSSSPANARISVKNIDLTPILMLLLD